MVLSVRLSLCPFQLSSCWGVSLSLLELSPDPKNEDNLKNEDDLKNGGNLKYEDDLKKEDDLRN